MASTSDSGDDGGGEFAVEDDGSITARDLETGLERGGATKAEALAQLADVLELHEGGEPIEDPAAFLSEELDIDADDVGGDDIDGDREQPDFLG